ncbi:MAG: RNA 2',3'-cyclic phosphodiesterase [Porphyrobacter sp.]|nr:RNA 2',3'-cyclic phosphodiesterase [Porphyrobacter sp.]
MTHRLFVAIRPPEPVRERLLDTMEAVEGARWQDEAHLHLTLRFVGSVERPVANELAGALARLRAPPFALAVRGVGHFEHKGRPQALWARVPPEPGLEVLRARVERACAEIGLGRETRRFVPHITLARLGGGSGPVGGWLASHGGLRAGPWPVEAFSLYESHLGQHGALYEEVARYPLAPDAGAGQPRPR